MGATPFRWLLAAAAALAVQATALPSAHSVDGPDETTAPPMQELAPNHARVSFRLIDARGNVRPGGHVTRLAWVWSKGSVGDPIDSPALRVWLSTDLPEDWAVRKITGDGVTVAENFQPGKTQTIALDLRARTGSLRLDFVDARERPQQMTLAVSLTVSRPYVLIRPECTALNIHLLVNKVAARNLFAGLGCLDRGNAVDVYFFRSKDSSWLRGPGLVDFDPEGRYAAFKYHYGKPAAAVTTPLPLFRVGTSDDQKQDAEYSVYYQEPARQHGPLFARVGAAPYFSAYDDTRHRYHIDQYALNVRAMGGLHLVENIVDLTVDVNADAFAFHSQPHELPSARFYGIEPRFNVRLPFEALDTSVWLSGGWLVWGMHVANNFYGISPLGGAEFLIELRHVPEGRHGFWGWYKRSGLADRAELQSGDNLEQAFGFAYELGLHERLPFALTFDYRRDHSRSSDGNNTIDGWAAALGVQKPF